MWLCVVPIVTLMSLTFFLGENCSLSCHFCLVLDELFTLFFMKRRIAQFHAKIFKINTIEQREKLRIFSETKDFPSRLCRFTMIEELRKSSNYIGEDENRVGKFVFPAIFSFNRKRKV